MHHPMKDLPLVEDYGEDFRSRLVEWGGMIVSYETFPAGIDATPLFKALPNENVPIAALGLHPEGAAARQGRGRRGGASDR